MLAAVVRRMVIRNLLVVGFFTSVSVFFFSNALAAETGKQSEESRSEAEQTSSPRFILYFGTEKRTEPDINGIHGNELAEDALETLTTTSAEFQRIFGVDQKNKVVLRFLTPGDFRKLTKAPDWTSAMFYRGEISIPINPKRGLNSLELHRALRHEYVHAVIAEITNYRSPAWIDEGIAQLLEGQINPLLGPALRNWIKTSPAMTLNSLENGFTTLPAELVPAAYAESLFASRTLIRQYGFPAAVKFLVLLGEGKSEPEAFLLAFNETEAAFETRLTSQIRRWAASDQVNP